MKALISIMKILINKIARMPKRSKKDFLNLEILKFLRMKIPIKVNKIPKKTLINKINHKI